MSEELNGNKSGWPHNFLRSLTNFDFSQLNVSAGIRAGVLITSLLMALNSNQKKCVGKRMFLVCLQLFLRGIDGAPARVIVFDVM